jgi:hypothetical protein
VTKIVGERESNWMDDDDDDRCKIHNILHDLKWVHLPRNQMDLNTVLK